MANATKQLEPLSKRLSPHQQAKRAVKIEARKVVAETLGRENAITRGVVMQTIAQVRWQRTRLNILTVVVVLTALVVLGLVYVGAR